MHSGGATVRASANGDDMTKWARANLHFRPHVEAVIMRGLAKEVAGRYPDVVTFANELREALLAGRSS